MAPRRYLCACGCGQNVVQKTQTRHLRGKGPIYIAANAAATHAYLASPPLGQVRAPSPFSPSYPPHPPIQQGSPTATGPSFGPPHGGFSGEQEAGQSIIAGGVEDGRGVTGGLGDFIGTDRWLDQCPFHIDSDSDEEDLDLDGGVELGGDAPGEVDGEDLAEEELSPWGSPDFEDDVNAWDALHEDFEQRAHAATLGTATLSDSRGTFSQCTYTRCLAGARILAEEDINLLKAASLKVQDYLSEATFDKFRVTFATPGLCSSQQARRRIDFLAEFKPVRYHCCVNSCIAYTGPAYAGLTACPKCNEPRYHDSANQKPRKIFTYLPLIPRLLSFVSHPEQARLMRYRAHEHPSSQQPDKMTDVFDASHYQTLLGTRVSVDGSQLEHNFFSDPRDIALGFSTDGFSPFKGRLSKKHTAWPLLFFNYNLPPELRFHKRHLLCAGIVPGPKKPWDMDSYLYPAVEELIRLALGITAFDALSCTLFVLHAYLILAFGDIPAIALVMRMKGHNGLVPCRMCKIVAIRGEESRTLYVPLHRGAFPHTASYDPSYLPLRTHAQFLADAKAVDTARTQTEAEALSKGCGIKGTPLLSALSSLTFPTSFPYGFMHLIWENLLPNLTLLWTGDFKGLPLAMETFVIEKTVWEAIGAACKASGQTIPSAFGAAVPNIATDAALFTAETWSLFAQHLGPIVLRRSFRQEHYYTHFIELIRLLNICLQFEISSTEIDDVESGFIVWVTEYERCVRKPLSVLLQNV